MFTPGITLAVQLVEVKQFPGSMLLPACLFFSYHFPSTQYEWDESLSHNPVVIVYAASIVESYTFQLVEMGIT